MRAIKYKSNSFRGLLKWSLIRYRFFIPVFIIVQLILSISIIYGFSFITNASDYLSKSYLCSGAITMNIIAVTCVLAPQVVNESKQNGVLNYQKTLPISKMNILLSDIMIWSLVPLPGVILSLFVGSMNFDMSLILSAMSILSIVFVIVSLTLLGFAIAYIFPPNTMALATQTIMLVGLLFSPIIYPENRLPLWMTNVYSFMPFVPVSNIIRFSLFNLREFNIQDYLVVTVWGGISYLASLHVLKRRV